jgi:D-amino-acid dehydrogenase
MRDPVADPVQEEWWGWRPMVPDGKPIIGRLPNFDNAWIAAGHGMLGVSMATGTGKLVAELITGTTPHVDAQPYRVERFS